MGSAGFAAGRMLFCLAARSGAGGETEACGEGSGGFESARTDKLPTRVSISGFGSDAVERIPSHTPPPKSRSPRAASRPFAIARRGLAGGASTLLTAH